MSRFNLVISDAAGIDFDDIWLYIAENNPLNADRFIDLLFEKCRRLLDTPKVGRQRDELLPGLRSFPVKSYVIFYCIQGNSVEIVRIISAYRDVKAIFEFG